MKLPSLRLDTDSRSYENLYKAAVETIDVPGASIEFGVRAGGSAELIMYATVGRRPPRPHIGVDPWGALPYRMGGMIVNERWYPDAMRLKTCADLFQWTRDFGVDLLLFAMKDTDFFAAFADGVPFYRNGEDAKITSYSLVVFDAEHHVEPVLAEVEWAGPRTSLNGQWVFDDVETYDHATVDHRVLALGFDCLTNDGHRAVYRKVR